MHTNLIVVTAENAESSSQSSGKAKSKWLYKVISQVIDY